ncbi:hypothetical protein Tco_1124495 [Tanacetum coccineum]|uniref:Uncharacterized protein n=1 Tax=Tanacetum coccineum TaxID=301880 RepID=A0ABQ5J7R5_9ASTR
MSTLTFADTHNMVAFLEKPAESDGFHEIIDFLNANQIHYALTVNPTIYTSCNEQFWATAKVKTVNGEHQLQALVDKKKNWRGWDFPVTARIHRIFLDGYGVLVVRIVNLLGLKGFLKLLLLSTAGTKVNAAGLQLLEELLLDKIKAGTTSTTLTARLPILNLGEYDLWLMRIEQYFFMTDYSLWEVILNEEKQDKRNEMKARRTLLMALPNKDQLKFHSYKDAKLLMEAIEKRYGGNKESKKVQRTLLNTNSNSNSSTNEADNTAFGVSAAHTQSNPTSGDNLSDALICAFLASQPNSP